ncbi:hypothetical protein B9Z19DRAFT_1124194 [Tuber borchii]|uniref:Uncharacterized protein n=1 Tax=Tuber borchii TaxID=42251 RepID=A0A2T6ZX26_TUBBO|nr:hypothetical protein B9Z19DRAFT_1124194 [Tuber borchii]
MGPQDTSLQWPDFLRFRVLEDTTPFHNWKMLYQAQRNGKRSIMRDCYVTAGWDNRSKLPLWLPRSSQDPGTLQALIDAWFPTIKDKLTIIFEYIDTDIKSSALLGIFFITPSVKSIPAQSLEGRQGSKYSIEINTENFEADTIRSLSESSLISVTELISQGRKCQQLISDPDQCPTMRDEPVSPSDHISETSLSSIPSTPSLPQPQLISLTSSPPQRTQLLAVSRLQRSPSPQSQDPAQGSSPDSLPNLPLVANENKTITLVNIQGPRQSKNHAQVASSSPIQILSPLQIPVVDRVLRLHKGCQQPSKRVYSQSRKLSDIDNI